MAREGPEREWLESKTGSQHPWTWLAQHGLGIQVGPHGSRWIGKGRPRTKPDHDGKKPKSVTEKLKEKSTQTGDQAMAAAPGSHPAEPANAEAVYTTGPGQAVEYNYTRQGTYADDYAAESNRVMVEGNSPTGGSGGSGSGSTAEGFGPRPGPGQVYTGAANNPT